MVIFLAMKILKKNKYKKLKNIRKIEIELYKKN